METCSIKLPEMVCVPSGIVVQKDDRRGARWTVLVEAFVVSSVPVTQHLYELTSRYNPSPFCGPDLPVVSVSWFEAIEFCNALSRLLDFTPCYRVEGETDVSWLPEVNGFRLLTDAEWEYACRAGSQGPRYGELDAIGWFAGNASGAPQPVGQKEPNEFGLYDMLGNVWEWCWDLYDPAVYGDYRVFKGGGWADEERGCLVTNRRRSHPTFRIEDLGFRIGRTLS